MPGILVWIDQIVFKNCIICCPFSCSSQSKREDVGGELFAAIWTIQFVVTSHSVHFREYDLSIRSSKLVVWSGGSRWMRSRCLCSLCILCVGMQFQGKVYRLWRTPSTTGRERLPRGGGAWKKAVAAKNRTERLTVKILPSDWAPPRHALQ
jgi:hypothetical protein